MSQHVGPQSGTAAVACRVCGSHSLRPICDLPDFWVAGCVRCGHGSTVYRIWSADNQERFTKAKWTETRGILRDVTEAMAWRRYADLRPFEPGHDLLEIGCGTGEFLHVAQQMGHRVTGLDTSPEVARYVGERYREVDIAVGDLSETQFAAGSFDVVAAFHVLEHVPDPGNLLAQVFPLLRPGGILYVRVPNLDSWYRRALGRNWWGFCVEHMSHFTAQSLARALQSAGFAVGAMRSADSDPGHSWWPVLPLLMHRGALLRSLGTRLGPRAGGGEGSARSAVPHWNSYRVVAKRGLLRAYLGYREAGSRLLAPVARAQLAHGGGQELLAVAIKPGWPATGRPPDGDLVSRN